MARVGLVTRHATYQGELDLRAAGGHAVRLLDALSTPHRLLAGATGTAASLLLQEPMRRDDATGLVTQCGVNVYLRAGAVLAAYEIHAEERTPKAREATVYEQRRHAQESSRTLIFLDNGWRLEASVAGGVAALEVNRAGRGDFVACVDVVLQDPRRAGSRTLGFMAINVRHIEGAALLGRAAAEE